MRKYFPYILLLLLAACITNPIDTLNKRFAVFETGYSAALTQIDRLQKSDSFKPETAKKVADALVEVNNARRVANIARSSGDVLKANSALDLASLALQRLQDSIPVGQKI